MTIPMKRAGPRFSRWPEYCKPTLTLHLGSRDSMQDSPGSRKATQAPAGASYRERIYEGYASNFQDAGPQFDVAASRAGRHAFRHNLRRWLPESREAAILDVAC